MPTWLCSAYRHSEYISVRRVAVHRTQRGNQCFSLSCFGLLHTVFFVFVAYIQLPSNHWYDSHVPVDNEFIIMILSVRAHLCLYQMPIPLLCPEETLLDPGIHQGSLPLNVCPVWTTARTHLSLHFKRLYSMPLQYLSSQSLVNLSLLCLKSSRFKIFSTIFRHLRSEKKNKCYHCFLSRHVALYHCILSTLLLKSDYYGGP